MVEVTRIESVALLRMSHGKANAFDTVLAGALREALDRARAADVRAVVITGSGAIFSAGVDLLQVVEGGRRYLEEFLPELSSALRELFAFPKPAVAAINGHAIAGGCLVALACDYRVMARGQGRIGLPELRVGMPFPLAATEILRHALAPRLAQEAILLGRVVEAAQAIEHGFVNELADPEALLERAVAVARELAATPEGSYARTKRDLRRPVLETWARLGQDHDRETLDAWDSPDVRAALQAYVEKTLRK